MPGVEVAVAALLTTLKLKPVEALAALHSAAHKS